MSSLASFFKQISEPTPAEIDPEDAYHSIESKPGPTSDPNPELVMNKSSIKLQEPIELNQEFEEKYAGKRVSIKDWLENESVDQLDSLSANSSVQRLRHQCDQSHDDDHSIVSSDHHSTQASTATRDISDSAKDDENQQAVQHQPSSKIEHSSDLLKHLQASVKADIQKGQAVQEQLAMYNRLLALRIAMQKTLVTTNALVESESCKESNAPDQRREVVNNLLSFSTKVATWRTALIEPISHEQPRKRKCPDDSNPEINLIYCLEEADCLNQRLAPYLRDTIRKWSAKINAASALTSARQTKFNAKQNAMEQLDQIWSLKEERQKLIERSRIKRTTRGASASINPLIFDDRDFYHSLLKEVVETTSRNQDLSEGLINDHRSRRVRRENVDPRASKGRKLRYDIHEKLVSIMVPAPNELWADDQRNELFGSLLGAGFEEEITVQRNGLKLFD
ncbi:hypothetical protein O181_013617 [Austropuccinia psidii MF-1]|uniref:Protein BFR2 n=1 Tax=Austropuccinia psidii MF-1 TaxID=1389203 RepID=A0A9Q3BYN8_9BASI|nr:hypothetical protein [Austropuccinia psidii MF-1]